MPYKEKTCPKCHAKHNKRGVYCSRSCGNQKQHTESAKQAIATTQAIRHASGDEVAEEQRYALAKVNGAIDPIIPPSKKPIQNNQFVQDGDLWTEVWFATCNLDLIFAWLSDKLTVLGVDRETEIPSKCLLTFLFPTTL